MLKYTIVNCNLYNYERKLEYLIDYIGSNTDYYIDKDEIKKITKALGIFLERVSDFSIDRTISSYSLCIDVENSRISIRPFKGKNLVELLKEEGIDLINENVNEIIKNFRNVIRKLKQQRKDKMKEKNIIYVDTGCGSGNININIKKRCL